MLLERIYDEDLAQATYIVGCQAKGEAIVIDPRRDVASIIELAAHHGMRIVAVTETHIHADFLSGTRELIHATGATAYVSAEGGQDWQYGFEAERLHHGDEITLGNITVKALHTPGHTPEHISFLVTDGAFSDTPGYLFSGDFVFVGDLGRPDLLDEAAGGEGTRFGFAEDLYNSVKNVFLELPDHVMVYPAHGAGSACGKALGAIPSTTVGYERRFSWWAPYLEKNDVEGFCKELLSGQPDAHAYFGRMKRENRDGPAVLGPLAPLHEMSIEDLKAKLQDDSSIFVDTRTPAEVRTGTVENDLVIPGPSTAARYGSWAYNPEEESRPLIILADDRETAEEFRDHAVRVGIDTISGYVTSLEGLDLTVPASVAPADLEGLGAALVLDVRTKNEHIAGHVPGSDQLSAGRVMWHLDELPTDGTIVTYCQSGARNAVASAALRRAGYKIVELEGSYLGWSAWAQEQGVEPETGLEDAESEQSA